MPRSGIGLNELLGRTVPWREVRREATVPQRQTWPVVDPMWALAENAVGNAWVRRPPSIE